MHRLIAVIFCTLYFSAVSGQQSQNNSLLRDDGFTSLKESVVVATDKDFYISGETMWFKLYVLNRQNHHLQGISSTAYLELINKDNLSVIQTKIALDSGMGNGAIRIDPALASGRYILRAYTNWMKNDSTSIFEMPLVVLNTQKTLDTSLFMVQRTNSTESSVNQVNHSGESLKITTDQTAFGQRSPVKVSMAMDGGNTGYLSVAVYKLTDLTNPLRSKNWSDYFSEIKSTSTDNSIPAFLPELKGMLVIAEAKDIKTGNPASDIPVYLSVTGKVPDVQTGVTKADGKVYFSLDKKYGQQQLLLQTDSSHQGQVNLNISKSFVRYNSHVSTEPVVMSQSMMDAVAEAQSHLTVDDNFLSAKLNEKIPITDSTGFYGKPYRTYLLDNYKRFTTMEEVLREYVQEVNVRIKNKDYSFQVFNHQFFELGKYMNLEYMMTTGEPLVLLDGVPVLNLNKIIEYNPLKVRKLEVVADRYHIGPFAWNGLLSFTTYNGNFEGFKLNPNDVILDFSGWQHKRRFYQPDYSSPALKHSRIPDFRELLYWNPDVFIQHSEGSLSFSTGDLTGRFIVVARGVSESGKPLFGTATFEVKK